MCRKEGITVGIINRNYPPGPGITGESALDLAEYLLKRGLNVNVIHVDAPYQGGATVKKPAGNIFKIKTFYNGKKKIPRLFANLYEGWRMVSKAKQLNCDVTICMTDPPLLNVWAALVLGKKHPWIWWSMDLYPEAFVADKLITENNFFFKQINKLVQKKQPSHVISLGPYQTAFLRQKLNSKTGFTELPCGIYTKKNELSKPEWATDISKIYIGYCGNLGEAHSLPFLYAVLDNLDVQKYTFILSVYGAKAREATEYAKNKEGVIILSSVKRAELGFIDIHLASLNPAWVNVCVPSKTVSSVCAESAFLYCGVAESDNWQLLSDAGWMVKDDSNINNELKQFLNTLTKDMLKEKKQNAAKLAILLTNMQASAYLSVSQAIAKLANTNH